MSELLNKAIASVSESKTAFYRYITANDTGSTGAHQSGFYIPKCASDLLFESPGKRGENIDRHIRIKWQEDFETNSRFIYYGKGTRNEYRITRFGRNFPFFTDENIGDLLIIAKITTDEYRGYVLHSDSDIEDFLSYFNLAPDSNNQLIEHTPVGDPYSEISRLQDMFINMFSSFPETAIMAEGARNSYNTAYKIVKSDVRNAPDEILLHWINSEFELFRKLENKLYTDIKTKPFESIDKFVESANEILNRRKSRAGKSLEHHLAQIFTSNELIFESQATTEINKKPDFLFPNAKCYHNLLFPSENITILGAKTTCKDRWRQIISEADRVDSKYLFTLQQGISSNQLKEMKESNVKLVVPEKHLNSFPLIYQNEISTLKNFIAIVKNKQDKMPRHFII